MPQTSKISERMAYFYSLPHQPNTHISYISGHIAYCPFIQHFCNIKETERQLFASLLDQWLQLII